MLNKYKKERVITRKYYSKKQKVWVEKEYTYERRSSKGSILVGKSGNINTKNVQELKDELLRGLVEDQDKDIYFESTVDEKGKTITEVKGKDAKEWVALEHELDAFVKVKQKRGEELTTSGFEGKQKSKLKPKNMDDLSDDEKERIRGEISIRRMFANVGVELEDAADDLGVEVEDLINSKNWKGNVFKDKWKFKFSYTGSLWSKA